MVVAIFRTAATAPRPPTRGCASWVQGRPSTAVCRVGAAQRNPPLGLR